MRRSIQIVSACALLWVVTGPGTGVSDGLAAEGERLPCNNFCRTWMGYEAGERTAPPARSDETVTVKPSEVQLDPELAVDHSASKIASTTDSVDKLRHPKPKRKGERDPADVSNRRSVVTQSKTSKLAKNQASHDDVLSDGRSGSEPSRNGPPEQAEENVRKLPMMRSDTSSGPIKGMARGVPLPPRLPRDARPDRSGVAQAGLIEADQTRTRVVDERQSKASTKAEVLARSHSGRNAAEPDVSRPATGSMISVAAKPTAKTVGVGSDGAADGTAVARSPGLSVVPAMDLRGAVPGGKRENPPENIPDSTKSSSTQTLVVNGQVNAGAAAIGVVARASDPSRSAVVSKADALPPASAATGGAASRVLPNRVGQEHAVAADGPAPTGSPAPAGRPFVPGSGSDKDAAQVAPKADAPSSPSLALNEATAKNPPKTAVKESAISVADTAVVVPPVPKDRAVASDTDTQAALVASPAEAADTASGVSGRAASMSSPNTVGQRSQVAAEAAANPNATVTTSTGAARAGNDEGSMRPAPTPSSPPARVVTASKVVVPEQAPDHPTGTHVAGLSEPPTMSAPRVSQSVAALPNASSVVNPGLDSKAEQPGAAAASSTKTSISSGNAPLGSNGDAYRANPGETASMVMAPPPGPASDNPTTLVTISVNDVATQPEKTTIGYTITNLAASPVDILFIRCNAVDPRGAIVGSVFDYVVNIPAGQEIKRFVHMSNDLASGQTFSCANDAATH